MYINSVAAYRNRKDKAHPNYSFLVSYDPKQATVKRESNLSSHSGNLKLSASKKAAELAKEDSQSRIKKDIIKSLILVSFVLIAEVVVYLARNQIRLP